MTLGSGIAIAAVWLMPVVAMRTKEIKGEFLCVSIIIASLVTWWLK